MTIWWGAPRAPTLLRALGTTGATSFILFLLSACGGRDTSSSPSGSSPSGPSVALSSTDCAPAETLATFVTNSSDPASLANIESIAVGPDGTVYVSPLGPLLPAGTTAALPPGIVAIPPDGSGPRTVVSTAIDDEGGAIWVLGNTLYFFNASLGAVDLTGATPVQTIYQIPSSSPGAETLPAAEALDATGMYLLEAITSEVPGSSGGATTYSTQWSLVQVPLDGSPTTTLASFPGAQGAYIEENLLLDDSSVYFVDSGGVSSVPKTGGVLTKIRSDVSASNIGSSQSHGAARVGSTFFASGDNFTRFTLDPAVPPVPITVTGAGAFSHAFPALVVGDGQGAYGAFTPITPQNLAIAPLPAATEQTHAIACLDVGDGGAVPALITAAALDSAYVYAVYQLSDQSAAVLRVHR